ncbi:winged helix-turn-helix domain-containing protein [Haladaptatus sp. R4]|uniref:helix-turn-helix transcriptional regulator n=1 Tax=Haladaptatus sp. R4 TaxID=1679489 RepID=UPI001CBF0054|nr:helix-turn-helix domain-containing protein [Haladaptatus sp. R4]
MERTAASGGSHYGLLGRNGSRKRMTSYESAAFLTSSSNRIRLVKALREEDGETVGALSDTLSMSRSTVHRTLRTFTDYGWIRRVDGAYRLTEAGELVLGAYEELIRTIEWVEEYDEFLTHLGDTEDPFPIHATTYATMVASTKSDPYRTITYLIDVLTTPSIERVRGLTPIMSPLFADAGRQLLDNGARTELVVSEESLRSSMERSTELKPAESIDDFDLHSVAGELPFGVLILDGERVLVCVFDDLGNVRACLDGESTDLIEWATNTYETRREDGHRVEMLPNFER